MKQFKIYGMHRKDEIIKELERLGLKCDDEPANEPRGIASFGDCYGEFHYDNKKRTEVTLQQLKDMPTPKRKVNHKLFINLYSNGSHFKYDTLAAAEGAARSTPSTFVKMVGCEWEGEE